MTTLVLALLAGLLLLALLLTARNEYRDARPSLQYPGTAPAPDPRRRPRRALYALLLPDGYPGGP